MKNQNVIFTRNITQASKARLVRSALALGIVALIMQVTVPRAQAFDLSSLNGNYADSVLGGGTPAGLPAAFLDPAFALLALFLPAAEAVGFRREWAGLGAGGGCDRRFDPGDRLDWDTHGDLESLPGEVTP